MSESVESYEIQFIPATEVPNMWDGKLHDAPEWRTVATVRGEVVPFSRRVTMPVEDYILCEEREPRDDEIDEDGNWFRDDPDTAQTRVHRFTFRALAIVEAMGMPKDGFFRVLGVTPEGRVVNSGTFV